MERTKVEREIENIRKEMHDAYINGQEYENILKISQRLDKMLNLLTSQDKGNYRL